MFKSISLDIPLSKFVLRTRTLLKREDFGVILSLLRGILVRVNSPRSAGEFVTNFCSTRLNKGEKQRFARLFKEDLLKSTSKVEKEDVTIPVIPIPDLILERIKKIQGET